MVTKKTNQVRKSWTEGLHKVFVAAVNLFTPEGQKANSGIVLTCMNVQGETFPLFFNTDAPDWTSELFGDFEALVIAPAYDNGDGSHEAIYEDEEGNYTDHRITEACRANGFNGWFSIQAKYTAKKVKGMEVPGQGGIYPKINTCKLIEEKEAKTLDSKNKKRVAELIEQDAKDIIPF